MMLKVVRSRAGICCRLEISLAKPQSAQRRTKRIYHREHRGHRGCIDQTERLQSGVIPSVARNP